MDFDEAVKAGLIETMGEETDRKFMANVTAMINDKETVAKVADTFKLVYTPFHGCGYKLVPEALRTLGIKHLICEPKQMVIDGDFPTVVSPNPENPEGFYLAIDLARENDVDFILGTDPDSDRVGIMIRNHSGEYRPVTGNQTGVLLLDYLIGAMRRSGKMPEKPVALKTIVTTEMARKVAESNGVTCYDTFTGFKFMAEKKNALEAAGEGKVIFSYEESYGYMLGDYVRDKDAVTASMLLTEMAAWYAAQGMTLFDALEKLYEKYGSLRRKDLQPGDARPGRSEGYGAADEESPGESPGGDLRRESRHPEGLHRRVRGGLRHRCEEPPWSSPAPTCCGSSWRTAPPFWCGPPARSPRSRCIF